MAGWWAGWVAGSVVFVGRQRELSRLKAALAGRCRLVLVVGDAGVGKTRFAGEGLRQAAAGGMVSVWGACLPLADKLPLLPVSQALGELSQAEEGRLLEAGLAAGPSYVRAEVARLVPALGSGEPELSGKGAGWQRERLFSALAEVLAGVAKRSALSVVVEDVHWADNGTLDCLTVLLRMLNEAPLKMVVTCRSDESPLDEQVARWLAQVRSSPLVEEIRLAPLARSDVARQVAALAGGPVPDSLVDQLYARGEGNPFFTEQLMAAALAGAADGSGATPLVLPARLADLLLARAERCGGSAREVLAALAVAARPLTEATLSTIAVLGPDAVRQGLRELAAASLLADTAGGEASRPRHALLTEAVAGALLPGERMVLHQRTAEALETTGDAMLAAEAAGHWALAGRPYRELPARVAAARAAERVFAYDQAAAHLQRAIQLCLEVPGSTERPDVDMPRLHVRAIDALQISGDSAHAAALAEEAYRRYADHPDHDAAAAICLRLSEFRMIEQPAAAFPLIDEAIRLAEQGGPPVRLAEAWCQYGSVFIKTGTGDKEASQKAYQRAADIAEQAAASALIPECLIPLGLHAITRGDIDRGLGLLRRARALAEASRDGGVIVWAAVEESFTLGNLAKTEASLDVALAGLQAARQLGRQNSRGAGFLAANASWSLVELGRTEDAAALIEPLTARPPSRDDPVVQMCRVEIDMLRGDIQAAQLRLQQVRDTISNQVGVFAGDFEASLQETMLALWAGQPRQAFDEVIQVLPALTAPSVTYRCGELLVAGMRACADLAEQARARRDEAALAAALTGADELAIWIDQVEGVPFIDHPAMASISADRATWQAERFRLIGANDPIAWEAAARAWDSLGWPHYAGYARWRQAQAQLDAGDPGAAALRAAAVAASGHAPLTAQIQALAERARISLQPRQPGAVADSPPVGSPPPFGLTARELTVLRLLVAGRTNAQIGAELYISPKTASVHVTSILRKLGVSGRVQAAALVERAGILRGPQRNVP